MTNDFLIVPLSKNHWLLRFPDGRDGSPTKAGSSFIDFDGSPYIANGMSLQELSEDLPDLLVEAVCHEPYSVDDSGCEYFGYVIHTV